MTRHEMVKKLVMHSVNVALQEPQCELLQTLFEKGFAGYSNMPRKRLEKEMRLCGLASFHDLTDEPDFAESNADAEQELMVLLSGTVGREARNHYFD
jgi:hypothetical protein